MIRLILVILASIVFSSTLFAKTSSCENQHCIAVVDAGSTGSRLYIYSYDLDKTNTPTHITELWTKKITPGFASIDSSANSIALYLSTLLADAPVKKVPLYFYATAGMRLLPQAKQKKHYNELSTWFNNQQEWQLKEAKTLIGRDEALYGWLSVNYHLGRFNKDAMKHTLGVIDMGGASVQIVFPISETSNTEDQSQIQIDLYGQHYTLYARSFLGLGQTEMSHQFLNIASCYVNNYPLPDGGLGAGDALSCKQEVTSLIKEVHHVNQLVQPLLNANPVTTWYALGGLNNLAASPIFHFEHSQLTNQELIQQADSQLCNQQWQDIDNQYPSDDYVYQYCLSSAYYYALMVDGYGIAPEKPINYLSASDNVGWTKGVVLTHP